jgi:molybdopterin/thiamine biosynthesis adenylyltransferase
MTRSPADDTQADDAQADDEQAEVGLDDLPCDDIGVAAGGGNLRASRAVRLGATVTGRDEDDLRAALESAHTLVSFEPNLPGGIETTQLLLSSLARVPGRVTLVIRPMTSDRAADNRDRVRADLAEGFEALRPGSRLPVAATIADAANECPSDRMVHLHIGVTACSDQRCKALSRSCVRAVPDGYGAHLVRRGTIHKVRRPYATATMLAAAFAAGEAFIVAASIDTDEVTDTAGDTGAAADSDLLSFCPVTLTDDLTAAPDLPPQAIVDLALLGLGAVGTAAARILADLGVTGRVLIADNQTFAIENVGTYTLGTPSDAAHNTHKVDLAAGVLAADFDVHTHYGNIADIAARIDTGELPWPAIVLSGVDTVDARHDVQALWADDHIDVGTGSTVVGLHHARPDGPCLRCFFPRRTDGPTPEQQLAAALGIDANLLGRDQDWTASEIAALPATADPRIATLAGKPKCATANLLGLTSLGGADDFRPSVPFVSQQAACLLIGRLVAEIVGLASRTNFFQYDTLTGPAWCADEPRDASCECYCTKRTAIVNQVRAQRSAASQA